VDALIVATATGLFRSSSCTRPARAQRRMAAGFARALPAVFWAL
jgi:hypothetical protein